MKTSENIIEISKAMNLAQREMRPAIKDSTNPHFRSKYSDLASVMEAIREPIGNNGLSIWQDATLEEMGVSVTTRIVHVSGQWVEFGPLTIPIGKRDAHAVGSACSYGKRYALCAALGVVSDDDDGNEAVASCEKKKNNAPKTSNDHIVESNEMVDNTPKTVLHKNKDEKKYVSKDQIIEFNLNYDKCDDVFRKFIDDTIFSLNLKDLSQMEEKIWKKFMVTFQKHFEETKKVG